MPSSLWLWLEHAGAFAHKASSSISQLGFAPDHSYPASQQRLCHCPYDTYDVTFPLSYSRLTTHTSSTTLFTTSTKSRVISGVLYLRYLHLITFIYRRLQVPILLLLPSQPQYIFYYLYQPHFIPSVQHALIDRRHYTRGLVARRGCRLVGASHRLGPNLTCNCKL